MNGKDTIYLAGNISTDDRTYLWREIFADLMKFDNVNILDPCANRFNQGVRSMHKLPEMRKESIEASQNVLKPKDYQMVKRSTIIVVNLALHTEGKPMIGTIYELSWADQLKIPVIAIVGEGDNHYCWHPWIEVAARVEGVEDAVDFIRTFFLHSSGQQSAPVTHANRVQRYVDEHSCGCTMCTNPGFGLMTPTTPMWGAWNG